MMIMNFHTKDLLNYKKECLANQQKVKKDRNTLDEHKRYTEKMLDDVQKALESIHDKGYIHCDVKLENIVCNRKGATLIDFGLCR